MIPIKVVVCFATLSSIALMPTSLQFVVIIFQTFEYQQKNAIPVLCSLPLQRWPTECWNQIWVTSGGITANHSLCEENIRQDTVLELLLVWFGEISSFWPDTFVHHVIPLLSTKIWCPPTRTSNPQDWKQRGIWLVQCVHAWGPCDLSDTRPLSSTAILPLDLLLLMAEIHHKGWWLSHYLLGF